ncbi:MAG: hypothetical protein RLZ32_1793, partial [Gemmatimonadota bacterium]
MAAGSRRGGVTGDTSPMSLPTLDGTLHRGCGGRYASHAETVTVRLSGMAAEVTR